MIWHSGNVADMYAIAMITNERKRRQDIPGTRALLHPRHSGSQPKGDKRNADHFAMYFSFSPFQLSLNIKYKYHSHMTKMNAEAVFRY